MSSRCANSPRWMVTLCALAVALHLIFAPIIARAAEAPPKVPANPTGPTAADVTAAPRASAMPNTPALEPNDKSKVRPRVPAVVDDKRMIDLARRMAEAQPVGAAQLESKRESDPVAQAGKARATTDEAKASQSNRQKLVNPDDQRPLGRRTEVPAENSNAGASKPSGRSSLISLLGALAIVIILIFVLRAGLRRFMGGAVAAGQSSVVQVLTRVAVAPRNHVLLMRVGSRVLVVSDSAAGMRTLAQIDQPEEVADLLTAVSSSKSNSSSGGFRQMLAHFSGGYAKEPANREGADEQEFHIDRARDQVSGLLGKLRNITGKGGDA